MPESEGHRQTSETASLPPVSVIRLRVMVVGQSLFMAEAIGALLQSCHVPVVAIVVGAERLTAQAQRYMPTVIFCDQHATGLTRQTVAELRQLSIAVIVLVGSSKGVVQDAPIARAGLPEQWSTDEPAKVIVERLHSMRRHSVNAPPHFSMGAGTQSRSPSSRHPTARALPRLGLGALTKRERELLPHLAAGLSVKQVAEIVGLAANTVDNHKARIMKKLAVHKAAELTRLAIRAGLIES